MALILTDNDVMLRANEAKALFEKGCNCAQAVALAWADFFSCDRDVVNALSTGFGGGVGRMRMMCGACSGMVMVAGMALPATVDDPDSKARNYALVQKAIADFKAQTGSVICAELLGLRPIAEEPTPSPRTAEYYKKRPCSEMVRMAAEIVGKNLQTILNNK